jgi:hypothetical protein
MLFVRIQNLEVRACAIADQFLVIIETAAPRFGLRLS